MLNFDDFKGKLAEFGGKNRVNSGLKLGNCLKIWNNFGIGFWLYVILVFWSNFERWHIF